MHNINACCHGINFAALTKGNMDAEMRIYYNLLKTF